MDREFIIFHSLSAREGFSIFPNTRMGIISGPVSLRATGKSTRLNARAVVDLTRGRLEEEKRGSWAKQLRGGASSAYASRIYAFCRVLPRNFLLYIHRA